MTALHPLALLALPPAVAFIHRLRGGLFPNFKPPLKTTYWCWPFVGLIALAAGAPWPVALAWALGYFLWILPAWMAFLTAAVGAPVPAGQVMGQGADVRLVWALSGGVPWLACLVRAALFLVPLAAALLLLDAFDGAGPLWNAAPIAMIVAAFLPACLRRRPPAAARGHVERRRADRRGDLGRGDGGVHRDRWRLMCLLPTRHPAALKARWRRVLAAWQARQNRPPLAWRPVFSGVYS